MDELLQQHSCGHVVIVGDMKQHLIARSFEELLIVFGLTNQEVFPTHISGSSLDPAISDLPEVLTICRPHSTVSSSDHFVVLGVISFCARGEFRLGKPL